MRLAVGIIAAVAMAIPASASATTPSHSGGDPRHKIAAGTATNWAGYAIDGTGASDVIGSWTQPAVTCAPGENSWSSPWVGIDGDNSGTVEQTGTDSDCQKGTPTYYAWYEMYPKGVVVIPFTPQPGDAITGEVRSAGGGSFVLTLKDKTSGASFSTTQTSSKAKLTSVEWIMEGPSGGQLSNFGSVSFSAASAIEGGHSGTIGSFPGATPITMVTQQGAPRATPSSLAKGGAAFSVTWNRA